MNSVSWFIYIAQVSSSLGVVFRALAIIGLIIAGGYSLFRTVGASVEADEFTPHFPPIRYLATLIGMLTLGNIMPERNTMYAIAASEVGERIVKTEIASDATKALHIWIKKQIEPAAK
jgi:hypothetical protein